MKMPAYEFWFVVGSQHLYGDEALAQVEAHAREMVPALQAAVGNAHVLRWKGVLKDADEIRRLCLEASADDACAGVIAWMHTFSPAKMWIRGLMALQKPLLHLHTQFNRDIPWDTIDMDFMNLNQSAHGDREFGFMVTRLGMPRKVIVGHWQDAEVARRVRGWAMTAVAAAVSRGLKVARFGDNMRQVAVTEGDKVEAEARFGWSVNGYGVGDLAERVRAVSEAEIDRLIDEYQSLYEFAPGCEKGGPLHDGVREQARIELGLRSFLEEGGFEAFTTTFEDLHGLRQLPGLAVQRLMADGYGFGGEGDWKTAAFVRVLKVLAEGEGTSFMEDYTYHFEPGNEMVLGAHMLEVCPTIAATRPRVEVHPLSIGGKEDPARLVFDGASGSAVQATLVDLGHRFRMVVNKVEAIQPDRPMPKLPVARVLWKPLPSLASAAESWILAGGAHHTVFSYRVTVEELQDLADMMGVECVVIDEHSTPRQIANELRWNEAVYGR
ncbi:L-arabinose isomerase [Alicyclobacillus mali (ex Roth et al. 2021)]|uniref:L-arabinose isomerase n=1 Tax=Alicyclobacillus mali (ex Roth et al. 2021) TaxID=1123961 RepID=UPI001A8E2D8F|nr:L-arabinose isomerase [Alicyclobacillus mali (ex Roth et al. 2021)]